jgi:hypothetical protein
MRRSLVTQAMGALLVMALSVAPGLADSGSAMLHTTGPVTVNGKAAPASVALFTGDEIATTTHGVATIMAGGSILTLSPGTSLTYGASSVNMGCGDLAITALQHGLTSKVQNLQVMAASDDSTYEISHAAGKLAVTVRAGSAVVDDGQQKMTLLAGKVMTFPSPGACADPADPAKTQPAARGYHMSNSKIGLLAGAAAGGIAAGVVIAEHGNKHCVSPDGSPACKCSNTGPNKCQP